MLISYFSLLRLRPSPTLLFGRSPSRFPTYLSSIVAKKNPDSVYRRPPPPSKNLLIAKSTAAKYLSTLTPAIAPDEAPELSSSQAEGTVAASQANLMRVIVQSVPGELVTREASKALVGTELLRVVRAVLKKITHRVFGGDRMMVGGIDWVDKGGVIENVFRRKFEIMDPPFANVDHLLVLFSVDQPKLEPFTLTRFLVVAESTGMPVTLALIKCELLDEEMYAPGVVKCSGRMSMEGFAELICDARMSPTRRPAYWRGFFMFHTTLHVSLLPISEGRYTADIPGFNQPTIIKVTKQPLTSTFPEKDD